MGVYCGIEPTWAAQTDAGRIHIATKGVVQNGLVLNLDAGASTSYPGSGTSWSDLSGSGNNGTLTNGPTYSSADGGSFTFDGTNDFVQVTGSITTSTATFIVWIRRNGNQPFYAGMLYSRATNATGISFRSTTNELGYTWNDASNTFNWVSGLTLPDLTWCMCAVSVASSSATAYLCQSSGITSAVNSVSHTSTTLNDIQVGRDDQDSTRFFKGNITQALIYNRALTALEIQQNFNATRSRYGI